MLVRLDLAPMIEVVDSVVVAVAVVEEIKDTELGFLC